MSENFLNKYVIRIKTGHPGYCSYEIIATPEELQHLVNRLQRELNDADLPTQIKNGGVGEKFLLSEYATISRRKSSRVSFSFYAANDLSWHHRAKKEDWIFYGGCLICLTIVFLAFVGLAALLNGFWQL